MSNLPLQNYGLPGKIWIAQMKHSPLCCLPLSRAQNPKLLQLSCSSTTENWLYWQLPGVDVDLDECKQSWRKSKRAQSTFSDFQQNYVILSYIMLAVIFISVVSSNANMS